MTLDITDYINGVLVIKNPVKIVPYKWQLHLVCPICGYDNYGYLDDTPVENQLELTKCQSPTCGKFFYGRLHFQDRSLVKKQYARTTEPIVLFKNPDFQKTNVPKTDGEYEWKIYYEKCPECDRFGGRRMFKTGTLAPIENQAILMKCPHEDCQAEFYGLVRIHHKNAEKS